MWYFSNYPFPTRYVKGYMTPDNICDTSVIFLFWQCMWQGIWYLTMYVTLQKISFYYKVCDRGYDTWQCMWRFSKYTFLTRYVTGYMTPDNVCDIRENNLFLQGMWLGIWQPERGCPIWTVQFFLFIHTEDIQFDLPIGKKALFKKKQFADNTFVIRSLYEQCSLSYWKNYYLQYWK